MLAISLSWQAKGRFRFYNEVPFEGTNDVVKVIKTVKEFVHFSSLTYVHGQFGLMPFMRIIGELAGGQFCFLSHVFIRRF
jgi:hypothetical protein